MGRGDGKGGNQVADRRRASGGFEIGNVPFVGRDDAMLRQRKETTTARARGRGAVGGSGVGTNLAHDVGFVLHRGEATLAPVLSHGALAARDGSRASGNQGILGVVVQLAAQHGALGLDVLARGRTERHGARAVVRDAIRDGRRRADDLARRSRRAGRSVVPRAVGGAAVIGREGVPSLLLPRNIDGN